MANQPLVEPFYLTINLDGQEYQARITYTKSGNTCKNIFEVEMIEPDGYPVFCLLERPISEPGSEEMVWLDEDGRQSELYQILGTEIAHYLKNEGVILLDMGKSGE